MFLSFSTEVVPSFSTFLSSAQRLYQSSLADRGVVRRVWFRDVGRVSVNSGKHLVIGVRCSLGTT